MRRAELTILGMVLLSAVARAQTDQQDRALERYLERLNQRTLLIEHLDRRLSKTAGAERAALAERLTKLLAAELEAANSGARRAELERRARALLDVIPEGDSIDLRLSLHRAAYAHAEEIAERWRLRLASSEELEEAKRVFSQLGSEFARLGATANRRVENLERLEESARTGMDEQEIATQLADSRRQRSMAMYLSAWCLTYQAELENARSPALEAIPRFGWLLNAETGQSPSIERVPEHTLAFEHVARAAIGVATSIGVAGDFGLATRWLDLVEETSTVDANVAAQARKRRMILLANNARWTELNVLVKEMREASALDVVTARLLAVLAFELPSGREAPAQGAIRRAAFEDLIARNEVSQVVDLASRYGTESLGAEGFIADYVRGLQAYRDATARQRELGENDVPTRDAGVRQQFVVATRLLDSALAASDAQANLSARADAAMLLAASTYLAGQGDPATMRLASRRASLAFDLAQDAPRRADALWLQVRSLRAVSDMLAESNADAALLENARVAAEEVAMEFTREFPEDPRAGVLVLERASRGSAASVDGATVDALLAIDRSSPSYDAARRQAASILFDAATRARGSESRPAAIRFVEVAGPLLDTDAQRALSGDADATPSAILLARQILAVLLAESVSEPGLARRASDRLDSLAQAGLIEDLSIIAELRYRQLQIAALDDDAERAARAYGAIRALDDSSAARFIESADRLVYRRALARWRESPNDPDRANDVVRTGVRVLATFGDDTDDAPNPALASTHMIVSDAAAVLWRTRADADALLLARRLLRRALATHPNSVDLLARSASLASDAGDFSDAVDAWTRVRAGAELGTDLWFRSTTERIVALARVSKQAAAEELSRYFDLFPDGGPAPWGDRLRALRSSLEGVDR